MGLVASQFWDAYRASGLLTSAVWTPKGGVQSAASDVYLTGMEIDSGAGASGALSMQRTITFPLGDFVGIERGDLVTIGLVSYFVTEPFQLNNLFMQASLGARK